MSQVSIPVQTKIIIIEGIAGSGKNTLQKSIAGILKSKAVCSFSEEELLFGWKHFWIPAIGTLRLELMESMIEYVEKTIYEHTDSVFVFNRFHISFLLFNTVPHDRQRYDALLSRLRTLPTMIFVPTLSEVEIGERTQHRERKDVVWKQHQKKRMYTGGFDSLTSMYDAEQAQIKKLLQEQNIPYQLVHVEADTIQ
ncbi:MAG: hypothetical protein WC289_02190 [Patescibacteria group bacterium]